MNGATVFKSPRADDRFAAVTRWLGEDLLGQFAYLDIPGPLFVSTDGDPDAPPTFRNLGVTSHLFWVAAGP